MRLDLELQMITEYRDVPSEHEFRCWAEAALAGCYEPAELVIRVVDEDEITTLNRDYRGRDRPTNVLSFPFEAPPPVHSELIGDLVVCAGVVAREAVEQGKSAESHWAHMVVHGVLHLLGFDHMDDIGAAEMEGLEKTILAGLGYPDPYDESRDVSPD